MKTVDIHDARVQLVKLLDEMHEGEEIVIARAGEPVARLVPFTGPHRELGLDRGRVTIPEDFDAPLPPEILDTFEQ